MSEFPAEEKSPKKRIWESVLSYVTNLVDIHEDSDPQSTIANIEKGVEFKGVNVWVLFFAIIIASVGLNVNSTAVIIGAMLVSPLMGPIMGIGLAVGVSDNNLLRQSLKNLLVMVLISLVASSAYFLLTPLSDAQSELLARTRPTIFDVFIALFGGLAGIVASSRKQEKVTVVSGVAIATALMPPLCTAGYGLGTGQFNYFFGAFYLFFINSFFIAFATFVMVRYLKFPRKAYLNYEAEKRVKRSLFVFSLIVIIPSVIIALDVIKETSFNSQAIKYVSELEKSEMFNEVQIVNSKRIYSRKEPVISISLVGKPLTPAQVEVLQKRLDDYGLHKTRLELRQAGGTTLDISTQATMLQDFLERKELQIEEKDSLLRKVTADFEAYKSQSKVTPEQLAKELVVLYPNVVNFSIAEASEVSVSDMKSEVVPVVNITWKETPRKETLEQLENWLKVRLGVNNLKVVNQH